MKTLKILGSALALIFCLELQAYEASVFLKRQWSEGINRMCQYQDGTVLNMKSRSCPSQKPTSGGNAQSDYLMKEQLRLGQQSTQMMTNGMSQMTGGKGLIPLMLERLQGKTSEKQMENLLNDYPNAKSTLRDPEFINWVSGDDQIYRSYIAATSRSRPDLNQLNWLLTTWKALPVLSDPYLKANQSDRFKELWADGMNDDFDSFKQAIREAEKIINQRSHNLAKRNKAFDSSVSSNTNLTDQNIDSSANSNTNLTDQTIQTIAAATTIGDCILQNSGAYLVMEWSNRKRLGKFRRKFATIANLKAKVERALNSSGAASQNYKDKSKRYLRNIQQLQGHAIAFRSYMASIGNNTEVKLLDELIDCRA